MNILYFRYILTLTGSDDGKINDKADVAIYSSGMEDQQNIGTSPVDFLLFM